MCIRDSTWTIPAFTLQPQGVTTLWLVLIAPTHEGMARLSWPGWLVKSSPFPPLDNIWAMMIVWRIRVKIIRTVLCVLYTAVVQSKGTLMWPVLTDELEPASLGFVHVCFCVFFLNMVYLLYIYVFLRLAMQATSSCEHLSVHPSVCLSVKCVDYDKTKAPSEKKISYD